MPSIPLLILYGVWGTVEMLAPSLLQVWVRVLSRTVPAAVTILALVFWGGGERLP